MTENAALAIGFQAAFLENLREIEPSCRIVAASASQEAIALAKAQRFQAIFVDARLPKESPRDFAQLRQAAPDVPTVVVGPTDTTALLEKLAAEGALSFLSEDLPPHLFASSAKRLLSPRTSDRLPLEEARYTATGTINGQTFTQRLRDLSNSGLSFHVPAGVDVTGFLPGSVITGLRVASPTGVICFGPGNAIIRHTQTERRNGEAVLRVGVSFDTSSTTVAPHKRVIGEPIPILASLRKTIQAKSSFTVMLPDDDRGFRFREAQLETHPVPSLVLQGPVPTELRSSDVVRLSYSHHGQSYVGLTAVLQAGNVLRVAVPRTLRVYHRRSSPRHRPSADRPYRVHVKAGLAQVDADFLVHDLNATGLSIEVDTTRHLLPPGLVLDSIVISIPDNQPPVHVRGIVRTLRTLPLEPGHSGLAPSRCGIELLDLNEADRARLCESLLADGFPYVEPGEPDDFEAVWQFLKDAGFDYHLYEDDSPESLETVRSAYRKLTASGRRAGVSLLYRREGTIYGQITGLRVYSRTWLATHLAARQGMNANSGRASRALTLGISEYLEHEPSGEFVKMMWKYERRFSDRMFGWVGRMIHQPGLSDGWDFGVLVRRNDVPPPSLPSGVRVRSVLPSELGVVESYFAQTVNVVRITAEDLTRDRILLPEVSAAYESAGLLRHRVIRVASLSGGMAGFSLIEHTTPGIQFAELINGFDVHVLPTVPMEDRERVRNALIADAIRYYTEAGHAHTMALTTHSDHTPFEQAGFRLMSMLRTRVWHRSLFRSWADYSDQVLRGLHERLQRRAARESNELIHPRGGSGGDEAADYSGRE